MQYRKRPVVIDAVRITSVDGAEASFETDGDCQWFYDALNKGVGETGGVWVLNEGIRVGTLEGTMRAEAGDFLIRGVEGEIYPCKASVFNATYDPLEGP